MPEITDEMVLDTLREVTDGKDEFIYEPPDGGFCLYVHRTPDGELTPGCLVGHVIHRFGASLEELCDHEGNSAGDVITEIGFDISAKAKGALDRAQGEQDRGAPWGEALKMAEREIGV